MATQTKKKKRKKLVMSFHVPLIMTMRKIDTTALYLDVHQDSDDRLRTNLYDKRGDFKFSYRQQSMYILQHSSSTCTLEYIHISIFICPVFQSPFNICPMMISFQYLCHDDEQHTWCHLVVQEYSCPPHHLTSHLVLVWFKFLNLKFIVWYFVHHYFVIIVLSVHLIAMCKIGCVG